MSNTKAILLLMAILSVAGCTTKMQQQVDEKGCVINLDTPEGSLPGKIEQASGNSTECRAIERAIDKAI